MKGKDELGESFKDHQATLYVGAIALAWVAAEGLFKLFYAIIMHTPSVPTR